MSSSVYRTVGYTRFHLNNHVARGRLGLTCQRHRLLSTTLQQPAIAPRGFQGNLFTHVAAGVAGGAFVLAGAYTWYHFSEIKLYVEAGKNARDMFNKTAQSLSDKASRSSNDALNYLRNIAKSYVAIVPGASSFLDAAFDRLDQIHDSYREEVNSAVIGALDELKTVVETEGSLKDVRTAFKVMDIMKRRIGQLNDIGKKAGSDALDPLMEKYPKVKEKIGASYEQMRVLAEGKGAEAKALAEETTQQLKARLSESVSGESLDRARSFISSRISKIRELPDKTDKRERDP